MNVLQANLQRSRMANDLLTQIALEKGIDLLLLSEQYREREGANWFSDILGTAAIWVRNTGVFIRSHGRSRGFVWACADDIVFVSCYFSPNVSMPEFQNQLDSLEDLLRGLSGGLVVAGDFNARAVEWGMPVTDTRGRRILEMAARVGLNVANVGDSTTFRRPGYGQTIPDVTFASDSVARRVTSWRVIEDFTGSDHQYISFSLSGGRVTRPAPARSPGWNISRLSAETLSTVIIGGQGAVLAEAGEATEIVGKTMNLIERSCDAAMPRKSPSRRNRISAYWWTEEIANLRRVCLRLRRKLTRSRRRGGVVPEVLAQELRDARRRLKREIVSSKERRWKALKEELNADPWGLGYQIVMRRLGAQSVSPEMTAVQLECIVDALFPRHELRPVENTVIIPSEIPAFTEPELREAVASMKPGKAPGPDGIPAEVLKVVAATSPQLLLNMYNRCLSEGVFPRRWKIQRLVLISKGKGDPGTPSAYRPLCMLDTAGKLLERLLKPRLARAVEAGGGLSDRQYGFRAGRSTIGAVREVVRTFEAANTGNHRSRSLVLLATLDVRNAFNSAKWADMLDALHLKFGIPPYLLRILQSYLRDRRLTFNTLDGPRSREITAGAAQGSILGPDLWNIAYDGILRAEMPRNTFLVGYADDIAVVITAANPDEAQHLLSLAMLRVLSWMTEHALSLATEKTEIVLLTRRRINPVVQMVVDTEMVETRRSVKYLGIRLDARMTFWDQIAFVASKAEKIVGNLSRLMSNIGGPTETKRRVLMSVTNSVILYGCEIWADSLRQTRFRKKVAAVQRRGALRIASAYRTVSEPAILAIAGVIPIDLLAFERKSIFDGNGAISRNAARAETMNTWQRRWEAEDRGRWTARVIGDLKRWVEREHGEVNFYLTQLLSGHGCFGAYLHRMGATRSPACQYGDSDLDDALHTFFICSRWVEERRNIEAVIGPVTPDNLVERMLSGPEEWHSVSAFCRRILKTKRSEQL